MTQATFTIIINGIKTATVNGIAVKQAAAATLVTTPLPWIPVVESTAAV